MLFKKIVVFLWLFPLLELASAQPVRPNFTSLTSRDGLLSNSVNAILKDRYGWMWFGTDDGLNKFDGTNFTVYRHRPGDSFSLRANEILALHEDKLGNLWVGTSGGGISLYDRKQDRFINYPVDANTTGFFTNSVVRSICSDYLGNIWIAQFASTYVLDPVTRHLTKMQIGPSAGDPSSKMTLYCVFEDSRRRMWVGTDKGLFLYLRNTHTFRQFLHSDPDRHSVFAEHVRALAEDSLGHLWIGTEAGLCMMRPDESGFGTYRKNGKGDSSLDGEAISAISVDKDGLLWIGAVQGLHVLNLQTGHIVTYLPDKENVHSLTSRAISSIYLDKEGIYWFGTFRGGVNKYDKNLSLFNVRLSNPSQDNISQSQIVTSFAERRDGNVWVGTDGGGLYLFDPKTERVQHIDVRLNGKMATVMSVLALKTSRDNKLYIGTFGYGLIIMDPATGKTRHLVKGMGPNDLNGDDIFCIKEDNKGQIWVGTNGQGVDVLKEEKVISRFTPKPLANIDHNLPINGFIRAIEEDADGNLWIGSHGGGLAIYHPQTGKFSIYEQNESNLPSDKIHALLLDRWGRMWVGTYGGGLSVFDRKSGRFRNFSEKEGLLNTTIYQLVEDGQGHIWMSTNTGISSFDTQSGAFRNYTSYNGLQNSNFVHGAGIRLSDGELCFGGLQGFNFFYPTDIWTNRNVPDIVLTDLKVSNKSVIAGGKSPISENISVAREIHLGYKQNFALSFVALNYTLPINNHYAYKLEGFDKDWNYTGSLNTAYYTNLDPGEYIFHVKASNNDGVWSTGDRSIRIYVQPPFWRTVYAYIFYFLTVFALLYYSRHRGLSRLRRKYELQKEREEAERIREMDRMKLKFLTNLSHEFRTPISLILGPVDQLLMEGQKDWSRDKLTMVKRNARRLLNLVNQLLDFRKMEEQELKLNLSEGELVGFVRDIGHSFDDLSEKKNIKFSFESGIDSVYALLDWDKIERILFNLLSNAFKFTLEGGSISLVLKSPDTRGATGEKWITLKVTDTGIGIPADKKEKIFERFFQNPSATSILNQGSGIGLSITKEFVRMHGGEIGVESEPGRGTVLMVQLPLKEVYSPQTREDMAPSLNGNPEPERSSVPELTSGMAWGVGEAPSILVVEDNEDFRFYLKDNLRRQFRVIEAASGKEGWQKALSAHPHLIVSDIGMPEMDGIAFIRKIKADKRTAHIPVILLTALTGEEWQLQGLETGANDYITKPFSFEVLNMKIKNLLELENKLKTAYSKQIKMQPTAPETVPDAERLLQNVVHYLEENISNPQLSVASLSKQMGMSRGSLYSKLLEITGQTPVDYIRSFKLDKAAILLEKSDMRIAEIAYQVGFSTPTYFAKTFKDRFGVLPSEYVAKIRGESHITRGH